MNVQAIKLNFSDMRMEPQQARSSLSPNLGDLNERWQIRIVWLAKYNVLQDSARREELNLKTPILKPAFKSSF